MKRIRVEAGDVSTTSARRDEGFSLVEMVVTVALMGVALIPIMVAAWALVKNSAYNHNATRVITVLNNAADRVNRAPEGCDYTIFYQAAALAEGWNEAQVTASYKYYQPGATAVAPGTWTDGPCPGGVYEDGLVQMVEITVTSPDGFVHRTTQVVKSKI